MERNVRDCDRASNNINFNLFIFANNLQWNGLCKANQKEKKMSPCSKKKNRLFYLNFNLKWYLKKSHIIFMISQWIQSIVNIIYLFLSPYRSHLNMWAHLTNFNFILSFFSFLFMSTYHIAPWHECPIYVYMFLSLIKIMPFG